MCGIFGYKHYGNVLNERQAAEIYDRFAKICIKRGTQAAGIAYIHENNLHIQKMPKNILNADFTIPPDTNTLTAHCRLASRENYHNNENNHPFLGRTADGTKFAAGHNGILVNLQGIRKQCQLPETNISTDSYCFVQLLNTKQQINSRSLKEVCETLQGSFTFIVLDDKGHIYICRGDVPVYLVHFKTWNLFVYISTRDLFEQAAAETFLWKSYRESNLESEKSSVNIIPTHKGTVTAIAPDGNVTNETFTFQEDKAINHNWYQHENVITDELKKQLENLNNDET